MQKIGLVSPHDRKRSFKEGNPAEMKKDALLKSRADELDHPEVYPL